jgi:RimJ/RimL family protein N-acetyltransferase
LHRVYPPPSWSSPPLEPRSLPSFETERLALCPPSEDFVPEVLEAIRETFEALNAWMPWARRMPTLEEQRAYAGEARRKFESGEDLAFALFDKASGLYAGGSGLHRIDWSVPRFEIGYWVRGRFQGRGYATEAASGLAGVAFDQLGARRVEIRCDDRNRRSAQVAERAGFVLEGILRHELRHVDGTLRDTRVYARVR